jgi:hypothetical protein
MKNENYKPFMRYPKTTQELRANQDRWDSFVRGKRRRKRLPTSYDDLWVHEQKTWKNKRKTQYHNKDIGSNLKLRRDDEQE